MQLLQKAFWGERVVIKLNNATKSDARHSHRFAAMPHARARDGSRMPHVLTVAGSDSGAGAGIQADLKACGALGVYCSTAITALTAQNTTGVQGIHVTPDDIFAMQLESVFSDMEVDVVKTGMLPTAQIINILCSQLNFSPSPRYVLVKGGHLDSSDDAVDVLYDGESFCELHGVRIETRNTHGTGCTLASAIAAEMAKGAQVVAAVQAAKHYIQDALQFSKRLRIGKGPHGPLNHLFALPKHMEKPKHHIFKPSDLKVYAVTDSGMNRRWQRSTAEAVKSAIEGGATIVQLREKEAESGDFFQEAVCCLEVAREHGVPLVINDRLDVAMACGADGVHLGQSDLPVREARLLLGPYKIIGASCKTAEQAQKAYQDGANYVGSGGVYPTNTKKNNKTIGPEGLRTVCESSPLPVVAIGGINASNVEEVLRSRLANLHGVAVVSALFDKPDIVKETVN